MLNGSWKIILKSKQKGKLVGIETFKIRVVSPRHAKDRFDFTQVLILIVSLLLKSHRPVIFLAFILKESKWEPSFIKFLCILVYIVAFAVSDSLSIFLPLESPASSNELPPCSSLPTTRYELIFIIIIILDFGWRWVFMCGIDCNIWG